MRLAQRLDTLARHALRPPTLPRNIEPLAPCTPSTSTAPYSIADRRGLLDDGIALASRLHGRRVLIVSDEHVEPLYAPGRGGAAQRAPGPSLGALCRPPGEQAKTLAHFGGDRRWPHRRHPRCLRGGAGRRCRRRHGRLRRRVLDAQGRLHPVADHTAGDGRFLGRQQDRRGPAAGQEHGGRLPPPRACSPTPGRWRHPTANCGPACSRSRQYGAIVDAPFLDWLEQRAAALLGDGPGRPGLAIARSCRHKADIVPNATSGARRPGAAELRPHLRPCVEGERGLRQTRQHGPEPRRAVAVGMVQSGAAVRAPGHGPGRRRRTPTPPADAFGLPTALPGAGSRSADRRMRLDKKAHASASASSCGRARGETRIVDDACPRGAVGRPARRLSARGRAA